jgi:hypothetical protein
MSLRSSGLRAACVTELSPRHCERSEAIHSVAPKLFGRCNSLHAAIDRRFDYADGLSPPTLPLAIPWVR